MIFYYYLINLKSVDDEKEKKMEENELILFLAVSSIVLAYLSTYIEPEKKTIREKHDPYLIFQLSSPLLLPLSAHDPHDHV